MGALIPGTFVFRFRTRIVPSIQEGWLLRRHFHLAIVKKLRVSEKEAVFINILEVKDSCTQRN